MIYRTPPRPNSSLRLLKISPKLHYSARVMLELAARQPGKPLTIDEAARRAGITPKQGIEDVRALYQESERLGLASFFDWETDRNTGQVSFKMSPEAAALWGHV
jgi:hypothetical protein